MKYVRCLTFACFFVTTASSVARADTITFTYTISGNANASFALPFLTYSFVPDASVPTPLGLLDARYQGTLDFSLLPPSGPTTSTWDFGALGLFSGTGLQFSDFPDANNIAQFNGTSVINFGTGIFAGASGSTSYTGSADLTADTATFTEQIELTAPGLVVPEPLTLLLLGMGLAGVLGNRHRVPSTGTK